MEIGVEGDRNRVAGRDYQEVHKNQHLHINDNAGNINFGTQYNIGTLTLGGGSGGGDGPKPLHLWTLEELKATLAYYRVQYWSSWRGFWLNIPCVLMMVLSFGVAGSLFAGILPIHAPQYMWMVLVPCMLALVVLSIWMTRIRRIEGRVMAESQAAIDEIRTELRRRR